MARVYQSATGQSGIAAGNGGFDVTVKGNTDLQGGALTSTAPADKNSFTTGSLTNSDLDNRQDTTSSSQSVSLSYGSNAGMAGNLANSAIGTTPAPSPLVVRTASPDAAIPTASLFRTTPGPSAHYLIETDPAFADERTWLSSDYLLKALSYDPNTVQKRLGDGFYEQRLIREQVAQLTGYRYTEGIHNDLDQYTALMNAGATFAQRFQLTPGIALTPAQMAQLTSDIVWLVEQTVTLADGRTERVTPLETQCFEKRSVIPGRE